jgi:arginase
MGPSAFRIAGLGERMTSLGCRVVDRGDLEVPIPEVRHPGDDNERYVDDIAAVRVALLHRFGRARRWRAAAGAGRRSQPGRRIGGGDGSLDRQRGGRIGLIWVDAHGDMNTPGSTTSGNVHGMPLAALIGSEPTELAAVGGFHPKVDPQHTVLIGVRNLDEKEKQRVRDSRIHVFTMMDVDRSGIAAVIERAIQLAGDGTAGLHVSFDLDVCDPSIAPGVGTPVKGGWTTGKRTW